MATKPEDYVTYDGYRKRSSYLVERERVNVIPMNREVKVRIMSSLLRVGGDGRESHTLQFKTRSKIRFLDVSGQIFPFSSRDIELSRGMDPLTVVSQFGPKGEIEDIYFPMELRASEQYFTLKVKKKDGDVNEDNAFLSNRTDVQRVVCLKIETCLLDTNDRPLTYQLAMDSIRRQSDGRKELSSSLDQQPQGHATSAVSTDKTFQTHKKSHDEQSSLAASRVAIERFNAILSIPTDRFDSYIQKSEGFTKYGSGATLRKSIKEWRNELCGMQSEVLSLIETIRITQLKIKSMKESEKMRSSNRREGNDEGSVRPLASQERSNMEKLSDKYNKTLRPWYFEFYCKGRSEGGQLDDISRAEMIEHLWSAFCLNGFSFLPSTLFDSALQGSLASNISAPSKQSWKVPDTLPSSFKSAAQLLPCASLTDEMGNQLRRHHKRNRESSVEEVETKRRQLMETIHNKDSATVAYWTTRFRTPGSPSPPYSAASLPLYVDHQRALYIMQRQDEIEGSVVPRASRDDRRIEMNPG